MAKQHHDETEVERTTPQGTQEHGVDHGHEDRDVDLPALLKWFGALFVIVILTHLALAGVYFGLMRVTGDTRDDNSPWAAMTHTVPGPRLLPNPDQSEPRVPAASMDALRRHENSGLKEYGLVDSSGEPQIPESTLTMINPEQGPAIPSAGLDPEGLPQSSSGGRTTEGIR